MSLDKLIYKDKGGQSSSSKLWFTITNTAITFVYVGLGWNQIKSLEPNLEGMAVLTLVIAAIVTSNKFANELIKLRYGAGANNVDVDNVKPSNNQGGNRNSDSSGE